MNAILLIDYEHVRSGTYRSCVVSEEGGRWEAVWTCDSGNAAVSRVEPMAASVPAQLWAGIAASLASSGVFWRGLVNDRTRPLDPHVEHLIVAMVARSGRVQSLTFAIPADEAAPEFKAWLERLPFSSQPDAVNPHSSPLFVAA